MAFIASSPEIVAEPSRFARSAAVTPIATSTDMVSKRLAISWDDVPSSRHCGRPRHQSSRGPTASPQHPSQLIAKFADCVPPMCRHIFKRSQVWVSFAGCSIGDITGSAKTTTLDRKAPARKSVHVKRASRCGPSARNHCHLYRPFGVVNRSLMRYVRADPPRWDAVKVVPTGSVRRSLRAPVQPAPNCTCQVITVTPASAPSGAFTVEIPAALCVAGGLSVPPGRNATFFRGTFVFPTFTIPTEGPPTVAGGQARALADPLVTPEATNKHAVKPRRPPIRSMACTSRSQSDHGKQRAPRKTIRVAAGLTHSGTN
jgi:hypothetical protein